MNKNIWIINEYAGHPEIGMEFRHFYMAKELNKLGFKTTIISSSYSHLFTNPPSPGYDTRDGVDYLWLKMFNYKNSHNKLRVLKWFLFCIKILFLPFKLKKPDTILVSPMAPFCIWPAYILAKLYGAKLIYEVKDIWPLSLQELGGYKASHPLIKLMSWAERFAIKHADHIVSNLQNYGTHIKNDIGLNKKFHWISNGIDLDELGAIQPLNSNVEKLIPKNKFIIGYTGTVGVANALPDFLNAALLLKDNQDILFVIVGDGQEKLNLLKTFEKYNNILFIPAIPKSMIQAVLAKFDACFIGLQKENLFKYGVSPNKLFDYMYSGKPIVYAINSGENIIDIATCGVSVEAQDSRSIANGVTQIYNLTTTERNTLGQNGKRYVLANFTFHKLANKLAKLL